MSELKHIKTITAPKNSMKDIIEINTSQPTSVYNKVWIQPISSRELDVVEPELEAEYILFNMRDIEEPIINEPEGSINTDELTNSNDKIWVEPDEN